MRTLTVKRTKSFVACLASMKVYIEDHEMSETTINGIPCRKLGVLKNGEEKTFAIGNDELKVFVIADKLSKEISNDFYTVPAGEENVFLSGKNAYNLATGNAFRFDGASQEDTLQNRKKNLRRGIVVLCIALAVGFVIGLLADIDLDLKLAEPKSFEVDGMTITMIDAMKSEEIEEYDAVFFSNRASVFVLKEAFDLEPDFKKFTLMEYGELMEEANELDVDWKTENGLTYCEYTAKEGLDTYHYFTVIYKGPDAFWTVQFIAEKADIDTYRPLFINWAKSVTFD